MTRKNRIEVGIYLKKAGDKASGTWEADFPPCMDTLTDIIVKSIDDRYTFNRDDITVQTKSGGKSGTWSVPATPNPDRQLAGKGPNAS